MAEISSRSGIGLAAYREYQSWRNVQQAAVRDISSELDFQGSKIRTASAGLVNAKADIKAAQAVASTRGDMRPPSFYGITGTQTPTIALINNILNKFV
jgi:hypothetical protein